MAQDAIDEARSELAHPHFHDGNADGERNGGTSESGNKSSYLLRRKDLLSDLGG